MGTDKEPLWVTLRRGGADADDVRSHFQLTQPLVDIATLLDKLGIETSEGRRGYSAGTLQFTNAHAHIWTSTEAPKERQRFVQAYLLGHLLHHKPGTYDVAHGTDRVSDDPEALTFARNLLMPRVLLEKHLSDKKGAPIHVRFGVPLFVMTARLSELGLWPPPGEEAIDGADRREYERVPAKIAVKFEQDGQAARALRAFSMDISVGGLCVRTNRKYEIGELLHLSMAVEGKTFDLKAAVAWVRSGAIGVRFEDVSKEDRRRLAELVSSLSR